MIQKLNWFKICLFNLLIVAAFGVLMRYKIGFEFPFFNQKNILHAHSHFAFGGWISLLLMVLMVRALGNQFSQATIAFFEKLFAATLVVSYGMLVAFSIQGYGLFSIIFSSLSMVISFIFCWKFYAETKKTAALAGKNWMNAALLFQALSTLGTFCLIFMMVTKNLEQHTYLSAIYWYLHFQYNGWFLFAIVGVFSHYLQTKNIILKVEPLVFKLFAFSCVPAYGLSILWLNIPVWIYGIVVLAAVAQFCGLILYMYHFISSKSIQKLGLDKMGRLLLSYVAIALIIKVSLQLGSTIPAVSKMAFGFRPIVIAYLHLVLLAFTSVFLLSYLYINNLLRFSRLSVIGIGIFVFGILFNEIMLAIQGIASFSYTMIPFANEILFGISVFILLGLILINVSVSTNKE